MFCSLFERKLNSSSFTSIEWLKNGFFPCVHSQHSAFRARRRRRSEQYPHRRYFLSPSLPPSSIVVVALLLVLFFVVFFEIVVVSRPRSLLPRADDGVPESRSVSSRETTPSTSKSSDPTFRSRQPPRTLCSSWDIWPFWSSWRRRVGVLSNILSSSQHC